MDQPEKLHRKTSVREATPRRNSRPPRSGTVSERLEPSARSRHHISSAEDLLSSFWGKVCCKGVEEEMDERK
jgi:hypothetical protein